MKRIELGRVSATPSAINGLKKADSDGSHTRYAARLLARHHNGDWGDMDANRNNEALERGGCITSEYSVIGGSEVFKFVVVTEPDRSSTTIMTPNEMAPKPIPLQTSS